ncbi:MAG: dihydropteroate synthase [Xanthomarina sp.]|uniref:Dihydropteroate synthase n=1 Tax=Xanthomarina gelatinilytica TaxID=1137281 RepID=M7MIQ5_9FLAO|nr:MULTISPECIES: dihydropteroate synthase [Xanthomarina]EMQ94976.1 Dihydropteroate synthase [Xanthomarina gelatinilytica]MAL22750.1 dihydropteroate synthase [Xanthomarina sp.]MBF61502.1 dihydropteroate synthase [Xanthomarina sp.]HAB26392.1 dihydropteroate synthase [Xanthomarina gelatinilytica]|tara:strand:- start:307 stop:1134 length:828 start_codon:yes stop_codon:yes gene_type:complete
MTINCKGNLIDLSTPKVMGILNLTPDSFYDGGKYKNESDILSQVYIMLKSGATFVDIGAYSSRPNATHIEEAEELKRLLPIISLIIKEFPEILISIDTFRSQVAKHGIEAGAALINDISAGKLDENMLPTIAKLKVPYIMMHMKGTPQTMQQQTDYKNLMKDILFYFSERIAKAHALGIIDVIIDPGFGFAKTTEQNFELLKHLELLKTLDKAILTGLSRKSMIYKTLKNAPKDALNGTTVLNTVALQKGASILRVHDVKEAMECVTLLNQLKAV